MIRNIIFDVGKVLVSYEPDAYMQRLGISKEKQKKINEAMFQNKLWDTSDQGLGTPDEFLQKFIAGAPELADEITKIHKTVGNTVELFPYAMEWILDLKARGYHVYILSNYSENMLDQTKDKLKFLPLMDGVVFSYKIKKIKPDPEIYEYLCDEYWLEPEESVFIDDRPVNIKGAETCGKKRKNPRCGNLPQGGFCKRRRRNNRNWRGNCDPTLQVRCCESTGTGSYGSKGWCRV